MVFRYCLGMIMSVSTLIIFNGAATPSSTVNLSIDVSLRRMFLAACRDAVKPPCSIRAGFDRLHVGVGQAEMVADLVHQHVGDDGAQRILVRGPIVEDRAPIKP